MNILVFGGSRNIGYMAALRFLDAGHRVTFILRSPTVFDADDKIQSHITSGKARLVKGDALVKDDVKRAWEEAVSHGSGVVDLLLFSVGGVLQFTLRKGFFISPPNLCTQSLLNALCTIPTGITPPRIINVSSTGLGKIGHAALPFPIRLLYGYMLPSPHKDKISSERVIAHCAGWGWDVADYGEPGEDLLGPGDWKEREGLPTFGSLKNVVVVRPAMLTDGKCVADTVKDRPYRVSTEELDAAWTVSRSDTAHFIFDLAVNRWDEFQGKRVSVGY